MIKIVPISEGTVSTARALARRREEHMIRENKTRERESKTGEKLCEAGIKKNKTRVNLSKTREGQSKIKVNLSRTSEGQNNTNEKQCLTRVKLLRGILGKNARVGIASFLALLLLAGCGSADSSFDTGYSQGSSVNSSASSSESAYDYGYDNYNGEMYETEAEEAVGKSTGESDVSSAVSERKLIRTVNMNVETKEQDYDRFLATLQEEVQSLGGYIENMDSYNGSAYGDYRSSRNANLTLRIPKDCLDGFLNLVSDIANVVRRSESVDDVTLTYVDMASRRNALRTEQDRLLELLEQADSIEDILTIENRLSDVRYQLESMESRLRTIDNQVDYSTVYLYVSEVRELTPVAERTVWERISYGFMDSLEEIGDGTVDIFVWVLVNMPYLVLWIAFFAVVFILIKRRWKKGEFKLKREKKEKRDSEEK